MSWGIRKTSAKAGPVNPEKENTTMDKQKLRTKGKVGTDLTWQEKVAAGHFKSAVEEYSL